MTQKKEFTTWREFGTKKKEFEITLSFQEASALSVSIVPSATFHMDGLGIEP